MKIKKTVIIEFERIRITAAFNCRHTLWCESCRTETEFIGRTESCELAKVMQAQGLAVNPGHLHFYRLNDEQTLICLNSITQRVQSRIYLNDGELKK